MEKMKFWKESLAKSALKLVMPPVRLDIRRKCAWQDFLSLRKKPWFNRLASFKLKFVCEEAVDGGGPRREFFNGMLDFYVYNKMVNSHQNHQVIIDMLTGKYDVWPMPFR